MKKLHDVQEVGFTSEYLILTVNSQQYWIRLAECSPRLMKATPAQRQHYDVSPGGYGIHWPDIDEDLAIGPLLKQAERIVEIAVA